MKAWQEGKVTYPFWSRPIPRFVSNQAPDGATPAAKAPAGPDAVFRTVVNAVCASCHTLDRVNNKKGDSDASTTTVNRMRDKGAAVTGEQVPILVEYLLKMPAL